jgi:folate-binding protein YgfZ
MTGVSTGPAPAGFEGYDAVRESAAVEIRPRGGLLALSGRDAQTFLHGVLTNDVAALAPGQGVYAAYLTPQGRMLSDMQVLRRDGDFLLVVEPHAAAGLASKFDLSIFTEDVRIEDRSATTVSIGVHGPRARAALAAALPGPAAALAGALAPRTHVTIRASGGEIVVLASTWLGVPGLRVAGPEAEVSEMSRRLANAGIPVLAPAALEARRIEAGMPVFGVDMTTDTIPLEAGIEARAISTTKGCYVGQEMIVRILHRAHGRVARHLAGLVGHGAALAGVGEPIYADGRDVGRITSTAWSPALAAPIALAMVHRDVFEPGTVVAAGVPAGPPATVRPLPLVDPLAGS